VRRSEQHWRLLACIGVWLCLTLAAGGARAMVPPLPDGQATRLVSPIPATSTPLQQILDSMPCARCYVAPLPIDQGPYEEPGRQGNPVLCVHDAVPPSSLDSAALAAGPPRLCACIAFCRWLD